MTSEIGHCERSAGSLMRDGEGDLQKISARPKASTFENCLKHDKKASSSNLVQHHYTDHASEKSPLGYESIPRAHRDVTFATKLLFMLDSVDQDGYGHIISWQPHGRCFLVREPKLIEKVLLMYLEIKKYASFQRQIYIYGFKRITRGPDKGGYYHEKFLRGRSFLATQISRITIKGVKVRQKTNPDQEPNFWEMPWVKPHGTATVSSKSPTPVVSCSAPTRQAATSSRPLIPEEHKVLSRSKQLRLRMMLQDVKRKREESAGYTAGQPDPAFVTTDQIQRQHGCPRQELPPRPPNFVTPPRSSRRSPQSVLVPEPQQQHSRSNQSIAGSPSPLAPPSSVRQISPELYSRRAELDAHLAARQQQQQQHREALTAQMLPPRRSLNVSVLPQELVERTSPAVAWERRSMNGTPVTLLSQMSSSRSAALSLAKLEDERRLRELHLLQRHHSDMREQAHVSVQAVRSSPVLDHDELPHRLAKRARVAANPTLVDELLGAPQPQISRSNTLVPAEQGQRLVAQRSLTTTAVRSQQLASPYMSDGVPVRATAVLPPPSFSRATQAPRVEAAAVEALVMLAQFPGSQRSEPLHPPSNVRSGVSSIRSRFQPLGTR